MVVIIFFSLGKDWRNGINDLLSLYLDKIKIRSYFSIDR